MSTLNASTSSMNGDVSTTSQSNTNTSITTTTPQLEEMGQEYMSTVVEAWQLLRQRNINNFNRAEIIEGKVVTLFKEKSKSISKYEQFNTLMTTLVPSLLSQVQSLHADLAGLFDDICDLEVQRDELIAAKNEHILSQHLEKKSTEFNLVNAKLTHEASLRERWVKEQRLVQVNKAIDQYKKQTQQRYEEKLKEAILNANALDITSHTAAAPTSSSTTTTTPLKSSLSSSSSAPFSSTQNTAHMSHFNLNTTTQHNITTTTTAPTTTFSLLGTNDMNDNNTLTKSPSNLSGGSNQISPIEQEQLRKQSALDILEQYANGIPQFDDDYIQ